MLNVWLALIAFAGSQAFAVDYSTARIENVELSTAHAAEISQDFPIVDIQLSDTKEILWLLGQKNLWRWNIDSQTLNRTSFKTILSKEEAFRRLGTDGLSVFAASDRAVYQVQYAPFKVLRFAHPSDEGETIDLFHNQDLFGWLHSGGHFYVDRYSKNLVQAFKGAQPFKPGDKAYFHKATGTVWYANLKNISVMEMSSGKTTFLRTAGEPVIGIGGTANDVFVYSGREILKFSANKKVVNQVIPVKGSRDIVAADFSDDVHMYLFQNGSLEIYHLASKHSMISKIPVQDLGVDTKLTREGNLAVVLYNGKFLAFRITE